MIRRLATLLTILSLNFFAACGGGDEKAPPKVPPQAAGQKPDFTDLIAQAERMKNTCTNEISPMFLMLATQSQAPGGGSAQMMQMLPMLMQQQQGQQQGCQNDMMNFLMALNTIQIPGVGPYANHPYGKEYAKEQIMAVMNRVYGRVNAEFQARGIQLTPDQQMRLQQDLLQAASVYGATAAGNMGPFGDALKQGAGLI